MAKIDRSKIQILDPTIDETLYAAQVLQRVWAGESVIFEHPTAQESLQESVRWLDFLARFSLDWRRIGDREIQVGEGRMVFVFPEEDA